MSDVQKEIIPLNLFAKIPSREIFPTEIMLKILEYLPHISLFRFSLVSLRVRGLCLSLRISITSESEFYEACYSGDSWSVVGSPRVYQRALYYICKGGHRDLVKMAFRNFDYKYLDIQQGLCGACEAGNSKLIDLMLELQPKDTLLVKGGLVAACKGGHRQVARRMILLGNTNFSEGMVAACSAGKRSLVDLMMRRGDKRYMTWDLGFYEACKGKFIDIAQIMYDKDYKYNTGRSRRLKVLNKGFASACYSGCLKTINFVLSLGSVDYNYGLSGACSGEKEDIIDMMIERGARDFQSGVLELCSTSNFKLVDKMIDKSNEYGDEPVWDWNGGLYIASVNGKLGMAILAIKKGATNFNNALLCATQGNQIDLVKMLVERGATKLSQALKIAVDKNYIDLIEYLRGLILRKSYRTSS